MSCQVPDNINVSAAASVEVSHILLDHVEYRFLAPRTDVLVLGDDKQVSKPALMWHQWAHTPVLSKKVTRENLPAYVAAAYSFIGTGHESDARSRKRTRANAVLLASVRAGIMNFFAWDTAILKPSEMHMSGLQVLGTSTEVLEPSLLCLERLHVARSFGAMDNAELDIAEEGMKFGLAAVMAACIVKRATGKYMPFALEASARDLLMQFYHRAGYVAMRRLQETHGDLDACRLMLTNAIHAVDLDKMWYRMTVTPQFATISATQSMALEEDDWEEVSYAEDMAQFHSPPEDYI